MINGVTMALNVDDILRAALKEDITSEAADGTGRSALRR